MKRQHARQKGFSLLETLVVVGITSVLAGLAIVGSAGTIQNYKANACLDTVASQLRMARQLAISQRRYVLVTISTATNTISYQVQAPLVAGTTEVNGPVITTALPTQVPFLVENGVPDTPMAFGNSAPVYIGGQAGGPPQMYFLPTGAFTDINFNPINGTLFVGMPNQPGTARAVTILGGTGRVRPYTYTGTKWIE